MFLSRKRIRRLLGIVNQTQRANKKRGRGLQNVNRTLRHKKPLNLRKRTIRYHKKKYKGSGEVQGLSNLSKFKNTRYWLWWRNFM